MRIVAGAWRGRKLIAPPGQATRPTADRLRQALFDMITHAEWGGHRLIEGATVLDVFAGTGALGLEALSRGAAFACFIESDAAALRALQANVAACKAEDRVEILAGDALALGHHHLRSSAARSSPLQGLSEQTGTDGNARAARLVFLDPPYAQNLVPRALAYLRKVGRIGSDALIVAEMGKDEAWQPDQDLLAERRQGAARLLVFRAG